MAEWKGQKVNKSQINNGKEYELDDVVTIQELNSIVNNSLYASDKVDTVIGDAEEVVEKANSAVNSVVGTANEALFKVEQVLKNEGYWGSNPNLLINGDFNVNQRGQETYIFGASTNAYTFDRWNIVTSVGGSVEKTSTGVTVNLKGAWARFQQKLEDTENLAGKTITLSVKVKSYTQNAGGGYACMQIVDSVDRTSKQFKSTTIGVQTVTRTIPEGATDIRLLALANYSEATNFDGTIEIEWVKLEIGSVATEFSPRPYAEELSLCQRYYININPKALINARGNNTHILTLTFTLPVSMRHIKSLVNYIGSSITLYGEKVVTDTNGNVSLQGEVLTGNVISVQSWDFTFDSNTLSIITNTDLTSLVYGKTYLASISNLSIDADMY